MIFKEGSQFHCQFLESGYCFGKFSIRNFLYFHTEQFSKYNTHLSFFIILYFAKNIPFMSTRLVVDHPQPITGIQGNRTSATKCCHPADCKDYFLYFSSFICTRIYCLVPDYGSALSVCKFYTIGKTDHHFAVLYHVQFFPVGDGFAGQRVGIFRFHLPENPKGTYHSLYRLWHLLFLDVLCIAQPTRVFKRGGTIIHGDIYCFLARLAGQYIYESKHACHFHGDHACLYVLALFYTSRQLYILSVSCLFNSRAGVYGSIYRFRPYAKRNLCRSAGWGASQLIAVWAMAFYLKSIGLMRLLKTFLINLKNNTKIISF